MNPVSLRLLNQQLISQQLTTPQEVVSHMAAMQAQEYRLMRWAVMMRTKKPSHEAFRQAYDRGDVVRLHLMRGTWQLVAREDYHWMHGLLAPRSRQVIQGWMNSNRISISEREYAEIGDVLRCTTAQLGSATKEDYAKALEARGMQMDDHRLSYHIRAGELSGMLVSGNLLPMKMSYALAEEKMGCTEPISRDEALMLLTTKYFQSRQPATLEDYIWWSGLSKSDCLRGMALMGNHLREERWKGYVFYLTDTCRTHGFRTGQSLFIPSYDEYLIGYKSREIVLPIEHRHHAHNQTGNFSPIIAHDGIVCGNWSPFQKEMEIRFFADERSSAADEKEWKRYLQSVNR